MTAERQSVRRSEWVLEAQGVGGTPVPPSVLAQWQRYLSMSWSVRRRHYVTEVSGLLVSAAIPVLAAFALDSRIIAIVGSLAVLINGLRALTGYKESWASRTRARYAIEKEIALFAAHHGKYANDGAATALVEAVEEICAEEGEGWAARRLSYNDLQEKKSAITPPAN
ncbi:DUF4231 domain-containing protein [Nocardia sp. CA-107356]|uniref:DUF4231 domain-containing protein n=1 Tax=Nocardia sp. CA-107356 TaxID=3239972 RepID=UPI003D943FDB